jgi:YHS domain-containing protein
MATSSPDFSAEFQSQRYCFASEEARDKFQKEPQRYIPGAGGLDVVSVRDGKGVEAGSLDFAVWYQRKLYLFTNTEHAEAFRRRPNLYVQAN